jgi:hypothetical protein
VTARVGERRADDGATRELLGAWALDAVDDVERAAVEDLIARDPDADREARSLHETAGWLAAAVARPAPAAVREATLAAVAVTPQEPAPTSDAAAHLVAPAATDGRAAGRAGTAPASGPASSRPGPAGPGRAPRRRTSPVRRALLTLVLVVAVALPTSIAWQEGRRADLAEQRADRITALLAAPGAQVLSADVTTGGSAVAVVTADAALVTGTDLADPGDGNVYQLWVMRDGTPVPDATAALTGGGIQISTDGYRTGDALALTVEPEGGSAQPTSEPIVVLAPT